jgi:predicted ATPase
VFPYFLNVLADHISKATSSIYVVVSTHNPILVSLLQGRVKRARTYYVYRDGGSTSVRELDVGKMARDLVTTEEVLLGPPSEVLERYAVEAVEGAEGRAGAG